MKKLLTFLALVITLTITAQTPQGLNYQATVRNSSGNLITNQNVYFRFNIMQNSVTSVPVYSETHYVPTDDLGQVNCVIGQGTPSVGVFSQINWSNGTYYLGIELNTGSGYITMGTTQFLSVPYALCAGSVSGNSLNLQQVSNNGNLADRVVTDTNRSGIKLNTTGGDNGNIYYGISSWIQGTNGSNRAVQGVSNGNNTINNNEGVLGFATNSTFANLGTYGGGYGSSAYYNTGVKGEADSGVESYGVEAYAYNATSRNHGVLGNSTSVTNSAINIGVIGKAGFSETSNICLFGGCDEGVTSNGTTYGMLSSVLASSSTGVNYGVFSTAANAYTNYAGFFNGDVTVTGTFVNPSDKKLKREISNFTSALDKIEKLKPVTYFYDNDKNKNFHLPKNRQYGFIAQDLEEVFPELVITQVLDVPSSSSYKENKIINPDENQNDISAEKKIITDTKKNSNNINEREEFKGINYMGLISILTEGIKEQQEQINKLMLKTKELEEKINELKK